MLESTVCSRNSKIRSEWNRGFSQGTEEDQLQGYLSQVAEGHGLQTEQEGHTGELMKIRRHWGIHEDF